MNVSFVADSLFDTDGDLLVWGVGSDLAGLDALSARLHGALLALVEDRKFKGNEDQFLLFPTFGAIGARQLLLVGWGSGGENARAEAAAVAGREARKIEAKTVLLQLGALTGALLERFSVGSYRWEAGQPEAKRTAAPEHLIWQGEAYDFSQALVRAGAQARVRDWVNAPPSELTPEALAEVARQAVTGLSAVSVEVWDEARLAHEGCVGTLAVGAGSAAPPRMIHLRYRPEGPRSHVALVGKGVTFDSGGLSLKPTASMLTMKCDMGGAATMLGVTLAVAELGIPVSLDTWLPAAENMTGSNAYKLGDILRYPNGVTVEIHNTDAEGRLLLADALLHASATEGVAHLIDAATLTGACVVAVGPDFTGLFTPDEALASALSAAACAEGEGLWRLPLHPGYKRLLKSESAQLKNVGGPNAGATTAALFLQHFVKDGVSWAHLDIAGSAYAESASGPYAYGATGEMVRTLTRWIQGLAE